MPGTRIEANEALQQNADKPTHFHIDSYYTEEIICCDCRELFIHTAQEKKEFYENQKGNIYKKFVRCRKCDELKHPERYSA